MKKLFVAAFAALFAMGLNAQDRKQGQDINQSEAPEAVMETFNEAFASAKGVEWEKDGDTYKADFELNGEDKEVKITESGELEMVKTEIRQRDLPQAVQETLSKDYADYDLDDFSKVEKGGMTKYKVKAEKGNMKEILMFDSSGKKIEKDKMDKDK